MGKECTGLDVSKVAVDIANKRDLTVYEGSITKIPLDDNLYDMVTCTDVMEHLEDKDIDISIDELIRVSKKYITLKIANIPETSNVWAKKVGINNLHVSVYGFEKWKNIIKNHSVDILHESYNRAGFSIFVCEVI